jgi:hypothetical protein
METEDVFRGAVKLCSVQAGNCVLNNSLDEEIAQDETISVDQGEANKGGSSDDFALEFLHKFSTQKEDRASPAEEYNEVNLAVEDPSPITTSIPPAGWTPDNTALPTAAVSMVKQTLEQLVEKLTYPGCATDSSNEICTAIMLHPELLLSPSVLGMHTKMDGGLQSYVTGTAHAWIYTPKNRKRKKCQTNKCNDRRVTGTTGFALIFVYPDLSTVTTGKDEAANAYSKLHFGGRSYSLGKNSVLLQHGGDKQLR